MIKYKKYLSFVCLIILALGCMGCKPEARQDTAQSCAPNNPSKTVTTVENPVLRVVFDDKAVAALTKHSATAVYCVAMGAS